MRRGSKVRGARAFAIVVALYALAPVGAAGAPAAAPRIFTRATPATVAQGLETTISGSLAVPGGPLAGERLELQATDRGGRFRDVAHTTTRADGRYRFPALHVYEDTRYRVVDRGAGGRAGPVVQVLLELPPYPSPQRVAAAERYLASRGGEGSLAVVDDRGRLQGTGLHRRFHSASVVKSMLLVAYLRKLSAEHRAIGGADEALLYPMIHVSDNQAASKALAIVGQPALDRVARDAGMHDYHASSVWWALDEVSASDLARFFFDQDQLIPQRYDGYARWLLSTIEPSQSWGVPAVARPEFQVFFKSGWLPESEGLVNEAARLERPRIVFALAVLTDQNPSMSYGEQTIEGVTLRLLGRAQ
jgi:hypothetical protein